MEPETFITKFKKMKRNCITAFLLVLFACSLTAQRENTISDADKLYGLSKFWQEVNYNFAFFDQVPDLDWDSAYQAFIPQVLATENDYEYYRKLMAFCALLKDGHTNIYLPQRIDSLLYQNSFGDYRIFLENIGGKAIVTHVNAPKKEEIPIGSEVIEVNGMPTKAYLEKEVIPYISSSTEYILWDKGIRSLLKGFRGQSIDIKIKTPEEEERTFHLTRALNQDDIHPPFPQRQLLDYSEMGNGIAYVALNSFDNPKIDTLFVQKLPELKQAKALVIDLRYNGGGSTDIGLEIAKYLTHDKELYYSKSMTREHRAAYKAWGFWVAQQDAPPSDEWAQKSLDYFNGDVWYEFESEPQNNNVARKDKIVLPTVILTGHNTASAAEDFLVILDKQPHILRMGQKTYGSTGQPLILFMPGGGSARVCTKKDVFPDGREFVGYGIAPHIEAAPTVEDFIHDRDPVLERAIGYLIEQQKE